MTQIGALTSLVSQIQRQDVLTRLGTKGVEHKQIRLYELSIMMILVVQRSEHPILSLLIQLWSSNCYKRRETSVTIHQASYTQHNIQKNTHTRGGRNAPFATNPDETIVLLFPWKVFPVVSTDKNIVVLPLSIGRRKTSY